MSLSKAPLTIVMKRVDVYCDGGARGNPGPAALGVVVHQGNLTKEYAQCLGRATNNEAEYQAAIFALKKIKQILGKKETKATTVRVYSDSELLVNQMSGIYKIQHPKIQVLFLSLWNLTLDFGKVQFHAIPREENKEADALVNKALDQEARLKKLI